MKSFCRALLSVAIAVGWPARSDAEPTEGISSYRNIPLWEAGSVPGALGNGPLDAPFMTVFRPRAAADSRGAVVIAPGGGNIMLMYAPRA